jgi:lipoprotein-anchoring transpeptidase ErfK/SrfK/vancomycin resistance protein YoaR
MAIGSWALKPLGARARAGQVALLALVASVALLLAAVLTVVVWQASVGDRIVAGVHAVGIDLSGRTVAEARALIARQLDQQQRSKVLLHAGDQHFEVTLGELGLEVRPDEADTLAQRAWQYGRRGTPLERLRDQMILLRRPAELTAQLQVNRTQLEAALARLASEINRQPVDAALVIGQNVSNPTDAVQITPSQPGRRLNVAASVPVLLQAAGRASHEPVKLVVDTIPPRISEAELEQARRQAVQAISAPVLLEYQNRRWRLEPATIAGMVQVAYDAGPPYHLSLELAELRAFVENVAGEVGTPARNARLELRGTEVTVHPGTAGLAVDVDATVTALQQAVFSPARTVPLVVQSREPAISAGALEPLRAQASRFLSRPVTVKYADQSWTIEPADLAKALRLPDTEKAHSVEQLSINLDQAALAKQIRTLATKLNIAPENAALALRGTEVVILPGKDGQTVDATAAAQAVIAAVKAPGNGSLPPVELRLVPVKPQRTEQSLEPVRQRAQKLIGAPITLRAGAMTWTLTPAELAAALVFGETNEQEIFPYLSRAKIIEYLQRLAPQIEAAAGGGSIASSPTPPATPGQAAPGGRKVDLEKTALAVRASAAGDDRTVTVEFATGEAVRPQTPQQMPPKAGKWIEVNLAAQRLTAYEGDWPVLSTLISSGLPRTPTPKGTFEIFTKLRFDDMRGGSVAAGDYYFLPKVPYVMYFAAGGYALHGTYWHNNFGRPMSHGCVNLSTRDAEWLFNWAPLGTKVVIF